MINIEKEFYKVINEKFGECESVAYHLAEMGTLSTTKMEQYLIRHEFAEMKASGKRTTETWNFLAEKYCKNYKSIRYIIERIG